jgi:DNA-binding winged helix-turn-helix (wHTH) protein/tetratricopeptide (TPR) repeat protein
MKQGEIFEFGEFRVDPLTRTVRRNEVTLALQRRSFDVLLYLVQNPGRVIPKDELLRNVWPDTFVDENNLTQSISSLRKALAERPNEPSYISTLPGRGYQFIAPVRVTTTHLSAPEAAQESVPQPEQPSEQLAEPQPAPAPGPSYLVQQRTLTTTIVTEDRQRRPLLTACLIAVTLAASGFGGYTVWRWLNPHTYGHAETVLADLDNLTGDKDFDQTLNKVLQIDLQQSPYFTVVSNGRARHTLKSMRQPVDDPITPQLAREICQRVNGQVYLVPAIARSGGGYRLSLQANDCADGHRLGEAQKTVDEKGAVVPAFSGLVSRIRRSVGESRASIRQFSKPLYDEPTSSLEALKAYSEAIAFVSGGKNPEAIAAFKRAIELDPNFSVAYADMSTAYYNMADAVHDKEAITKAYALRSNANEREQFYIVLRYHQSVTGNLPALLEALRQWAVTYPYDNLPLADLVNYETWTGQYPFAAEHAEALLEVEDKDNIHNGISYEIAARAFHHANMPDRLRAVYAKALQWQVDTPGLHCVMLAFAAENGDQTEVERQVAWSAGTANESRLLQYAASAALADGQVKRAEPLFAQAHAAAERDKVVDALADIDDYHVRMLVELGLTAPAQALLKSLPAADPSLDKAFAEAEAGDQAKALAEAQRQLAAAPTDTLMNTQFVPSVRAAIALRQGRPAEAVALLRGAAPYELRDPTVPYLRGQAFLADHEPGEAVAEFAKLADHPWIAEPSAPLITLAHLGLARAYAMQHKLPESSREYEALFNLWKNADPGLPVLQQARAEYARVR